jgi:hypothetical protein
MFDGDLPETKSDLDKSDPVAGDWHKESRRAIGIGGVGVSLKAIGAAGPRDPLRHRYRRDVARRRTEAGPIAPVTLRDCHI